MPATLQLALIAVAIIAGSCVAVQQALNATLRVGLGSALWAALISYLGVTSIMMLPRLGAMTVIVSLIAGQLLASVAFDHFGLFGLTQRPIDIYRASGAVLLIVSILLIRR